MRAIKILKNTFFYQFILIFLIPNLSMLIFGIAENEQNVDNFGKKVLIATQHSEFKNALVSKVSKSLEKKGYIVKVINLKGLLSESVDDYPAIVVINTCWAWRINNHVQKFLKKLSKVEREKIILFTTAKYENWKPKITGVDAITAASRSSNVNVIAKKIVEKVRNKPIPHFQR